MNQQIELRCEVTGRPYTICEAEQAFHERIGTLDGLLTASLPFPRVHPFEALRQIFCFSHLMNLFRLKSDFSGKPQIARYNPALGYKICTVDEFNSGAIDNAEFGTPYDFSASFFSQFDRLMHSVFQPPLNSTNTEDSDFVNGALNVKGSYLSFNIIDSQDCLYCISQYFGNDNISCVQTNRCQFCYGCVNIDGCYECQHCLFSTNCSGCFACYDCIGCNDCIGCVGLRNARYHIFNKEYSREQFTGYLSSRNLGSHIDRSKLRAECENFIAAEKPRRTFLVNTEDSSGNYLRSCRNLHNCYLGSNSEDCGYLIPLFDSRDCWYGWAMNSELTFFSGTMRSRNIAYSYSTMECENCIYCYQCYNHCTFCIGCVGLRGKSYCILNQQYSKDEFFELAPRVIRQMQSRNEWGRFFPPSTSPFPYFESGAPDFLEPLPETELLTRGYRVMSIPEPPAPPNAVPGNSLPDDINSVDPDAWTGKAIKCVETGWVFNLQKKEIQIYKRLNIPLPRIHWKHSLAGLLHLRERLPAV